MVFVENGKRLKMARYPVGYLGAGARRRATGTGALPPPVENLGILPMGVWHGSVKVHQWELISRGDLSFAANFVFFG